MPLFGVGLRTSLLYWRIEGDSASADNSDDDAVTLDQEIIGTPVEDEATSLLTTQQLAGARSYLRKADKEFL